MGRLREHLPSLWHIYSHLRDNYIDESHTSRMLHNPDYAFFSEKINSEADELMKALKGEHTAEEHGLPEGTDIIIYEGHQLLYWCILAGLSKMEYKELKPHNHINRGYRRGMGGHGTPRIGFVPPPYETVPRIGITEADTSERARKSLSSSLEFLGKVCKISDVHPISIVEYDMNSMRTKPYLQDLF